MAAIDFPNSPTTGQQFTAAGITWEWSGSVWNIVTGASVITQTYVGSTLFLYYNFY